eukprot:CAMPEP_0183297022 /NCGR_PEP_ID=MMETSP0160_2-20130417/4406_1 /TAXON_ID=2839 ORGANISM="Odontella Sinensis, Strain Grunow 1884" /NCGR_SAMPLE_ID=MMETSP0160_2 /ASSEMBLY_ACC=CAM_ASM_000250 /LENGTH=396 /DNA_ID=CAMNT_0025458747 /DNA_START=172 /DNA_END=1362 /DNA_ORIENTATION=-
MSRQYQSLLKSLFDMDQVPTSSSVAGDRLDSILPSFLKRRWDSVASRCQFSGAVIHFLSLSSDGDVRKFEESSGEKSGLSLLSVTKGVGDTEDTIECTSDSIIDSRRSIALRIEREESFPTLLALKLVAFGSLGLEISGRHLTGSLPLLELPCRSGEKVKLRQCDTESRSHGSSLSFRLREVVLPYFDDENSHSGSSVASAFFRSSLSRPMVGLFQWPKSNNSGIVFRPLPAAREDLTLTSPSLVFQCPSLDSAKSRIENCGATTAKVGFRGDGKCGQLLVKHHLLSGLDFRLCEATSLSTTFAEAQESLLAGSLADLQSSNVLAEGGNQRHSGEDFARSDVMNGLGDCWVEFRANVRKPSGFFRKAKVFETLKNDGASGLKGGGRVARSPDIPPE